LLLFVAVGVARHRAAAVEVQSKQTTQLPIPLSAEIVMPLCSHLSTITIY
jgi:hypothetical protein